MWVTRETVDVGFEVAVGADNMVHEVEGAQHADAWVAWCQGRSPCMQPQTPSRGACSGAMCKILTSPHIGCLSGISIGCDMVPLFLKFCSVLQASVGSANPAS